MKSDPKALGAKILCISLLLATASSSFAIIRSPYPVKTLPPYRGQFVIIGENSITRTAQDAPATAWK